MQLRLLTAFLALFLLLPAQGQQGIDYSSQEFVILVGGPALRKWENLRHVRDRHDRVWWNFMTSARLRTQQLRRAHGDSAQITWLVYKRGYVDRGKEDGTSHLGTIAKRASQYKTKLVYYDTGDDVINYLNKGVNRRRIKIATFDYFGHSNKYCFLLDYSCEILGASRSYIHQRDLHKLKRGLFTDSARVCSYGCHTGESMSKVWRGATGVRMRGAIGKTTYERILADNALPVLSSSARGWAD